MMKRMLAIAAVSALILVAGVHKADAHGSFSIGIGIPGLYIGPPAVYSAPAYYYPPPPPVYYAPPAYYPPYYYGGSAVYFGGRFGHRGRHHWGGHRWSGHRHWR